MLLRLTDGATTLTLSGAGAYLGATYFPTRQAGDRRISESAVLILEGTESAVRAAVNAVEDMLAQARDGETLGIAPVYVEFRPTSSGDIRRARVYDGFTNWSQVAAERLLTAALNTVRVVVTWERDGDWLGPEAELPLASATQTERTGGVTVTGAANANYAHITAANVLGTRPAAVRLRITNSSGGGLAWRTFYVGANAFSAPGSADLWLLGSEATTGAAKSWTAGVGHSTLTWLFPLSATLLGQAQGRTFRVLAAFDSLTSTANLRAAVGSYIDSLYVPLRLGNERAAASKLLDLGEFPIPPGGYNSGNSGAALAITVRSAYAGSGTLNFVMLMPTDGYRKLEQVGYTASSGVSIEDDGAEGRAYILDGTSRYTVVRATGDPLRVFPGRDNRLYILFDEGANFVAGRQMTVQAWYRPVYDNV